MRSKSGMAVRQARVEHGMVDRLGWGDEGELGIVSEDESDYAAVSEHE